MITILSIMICFGLVSFVFLMLGDAYAVKHPDSAWAKWWFRHVVEHLDPDDETF